MPYSFLEPCKDSTQHPRPDLEERTQGQLIPSIFLVGALQLLFVTQGSRIRTLQNGGYGSPWMLVLRILPRHLGDGFSRSAIAPPGRPGWLRDDEAAPQAWLRGIGDCGCCRAWILTKILLSHILNIQQAYRMLRIDLKFTCR